MRWRRLGRARPIDTALDLAQLVRQFGEFALELFDLFPLVGDRGAEVLDGAVLEGNAFL